MINLDELKPVLEGLLEGRDDAGDVIANISSLDKPYEKGYTEDDLNARIAENDSLWNEKFKKAFFGEKADTLTGEADDTPADASPNADNGGENSGEDITIDDLFTKEEN